MEYGIKEVNGKFYPGVWVKTMEREKWFGKKMEKRTFFTFDIHGIPYSYHVYRELAPPPLMPFSTLEQAKQYIDKKRNPVKKEIKYHPYGNQTPKG